MIIVSCALMAAITTIVVLWEDQENRPAALTSARERASSGNSKGVRGSPPRLALWTLHSPPNTTAKHRCDPVGVTLDLCLNLLTAGHSCRWPLWEGQDAGSAGRGERRIMREELGEDWEGCNGEYRQKNWWTSEWWGIKDGGKEIRWVRWSSDARISISCHGCA